MMLIEHNRKVNSLLDEIDKRFDLREKLLNSLPVDSRDCLIPDDPATMKAREPLMRWTREIGERLKRLEQLGVELDPELAETMRLELLAALERKLN